MIDMSTIIRRSSVTVSADRDQLHHILKEVFINRKYVIGKCNCKSCIKPKDNMRVLVLDLLEAIFGIRHIPRIFDPKYGFMHQETSPREYTPNTTAQWKNVFKSSWFRYNEDHNVRMNLMKEVDKHPDEYDICVDCGKWYKKTTGAEVDAGPNSDADTVMVCSRCRDQKYFECNVCGKIKHRVDPVYYQPEYDNQKWEETRYDRNSPQMCNHCYKTKFLPCQSCSMPLREEYQVNVSFYFGYNNDVSIVPIHIEEQRYDMETGRWHDHGDLEIQHRPHSVLCKHCRDIHIRLCHGCGEEMYDGHMVRRVSRGEEIYLCENCQEEARVIKQYNYSPTLKFLTAKAEKARATGLFYGTEIEVEHVGKNPNAGPNCTRDDKGEDIYDWWGNKDDFYLKNDGSLENGFEIVTQPFTWSHYIANKDKWTDFLLWLKGNGLAADHKTLGGVSTCGLHIHMSKDAFTPHHLYKFVNFFYKQSTRPFVTGIAQRTSMQYARFMKEDASHTIHLAKYKENFSGDRYSAVNLMGGSPNARGSHPAKTVEIRIFRGTLEPFIFHKNFEFLHSLYEFTQCHTPKEMMVRKYVDYLLKKQGQWRSLINFVKNSHYINKSYSYIKPMMKGV